MNIKLNDNSDCVEEIHELKTLLKQNRRYLYTEYSYKAIVEIAIDELYTRICSEKKSGENQRR